MKQLIECVPNFSEGRDLNIIRQITDRIESVEGIKLLNVDPGNATNRTVVTFVGEPAPATDVCPLIPISGITMEETVVFAKKLGEKVGKNLNIHVYL